MKAPVLLVLAAGLGSRYGGIKQMDPVGPDGEFVIDYSVYDAWRAGFGSVVFIIREELEEPLREHFEARLAGRLEMGFVCQRMTDLPGSFECPPMRQKPWGTGHAIWSARKAVGGNFAAVNADDFYGAGAFRAIAGFLLSDRCTPDTYAMVAYRLGNTLSDFGSVSRGICTVGGDGLLADVVERTCIERTPGGARYKDGGDWVAISPDELCSLNLWGFNASLFPRMEELFVDFLRENLNEQKKEFFIPSVVDALIKAGRCRTRVLPTDERWFGMTYKEDRQLVVDRIAGLTRAGVYPAHLWK